MIFNNLFCDSFFSFFSYHVQAYIQYVKECVNSSLEGCTHLDTQLVQGSVPVLVVSQLRLAQTGSDQFGQANTSSPSENTWVPTLKTNLVSQPDSVGGQVNIYIQYVEHKKKKNLPLGILQFHSCSPGSVHTTAGACGMQRDYNQMSLYLVSKLAS